MGGARPQRVAPSRPCQLTAQLEEFSRSGQAVVGKRSPPPCILIYDDEEANPVPLPPL